MSGLAIAFFTTASSSSMVKKGEKMSLKEFNFITSYITCSASVDVILMSTFLCILIST